MLRLGNGGKFKKILTLKCLLGVNGDRAGPRRAGRCTSTLNKRSSDKMSADKMSTDLLRLAD